MPPDAVQRLWPDLWRWLEQGAQAAAHPIEIGEIYGRVLDGRWQVWGIRQDGATIGAVCTEVYDSTAGRTCALPIVGGRNMAGWLHLVSVIEDWARAQGCVRLEGNGRAGWERALKPLGWATIATIVEKRL